MADKSIEKSSKAYYALYDFLIKTPFLPKGRTSINFDTLTGGEMTISSIAYNVVSDNGNAMVKYMPGITKYTPVTLLRAFDNGAKEMHEMFSKMSNLNMKTRSNFSVVMINGEGKPQALWHLINAMPVKISGFSFNAFKADYYTDFEITLQPDFIELVFA
ncbi:MAG: phage tail protein [Anaerolineae bacterium]|nr:phage tail protein [Anaerolineae bacterium]